jgi:hypothetical protein
MELTTEIPANDSDTFRLNGMNIMELELLRVSIKTKQKGEVLV